MQITLDDFNSHAHVERDGTRLSDFQDRYISTHTLTWSVTVQHDEFTKGNDDFNSHAHVERDESPSRGH